MNKEIRKNGWWWVQTKDAGIVPDYCFQDHFSDDDGVVEVLEPCNYQELQRLKNKVEDLSYNLKAATKGLKLWQKDFETLCGLLKECKASVKLNSDITRGLEGKNSTNYQNLLNILSRINAVTGESEDK